MLSGRLPFFYGWVIVALSTLVNLLAWSVRSSFALFYAAFVRELGWGRGEAALGYSLSWLCLFVFSPLAGRLYDRLGPRVIIPLGGLLLGTGLALTGQVRASWQYDLTFGVLVAAGMAGVMIPAAAVLGQWFVRHRGTAMGFISAGSSVSAVLFYPLNTWLIAQLGWRYALAVYGLIVALGIAPLAACFYRRHPSEVGQTPDGIPEEAVGVADEPCQQWELPLRCALRTPQLWAVFAMWGLGVIGYQIMTTHQVAHALAQGFTPATLAWVFSLAGACTTLGNLLGGALSDRWGREWVFSLGTAIAIAGVVRFAALAGAHDTAGLLFYALAGVGFGMRIALLAAIPADLFHGPYFGAILGFANGGGGLGGFIGPFLAGLLYDLTGTYQLAFTISALALAGAAVSVWIAAPRRARSRTRR
ncbi:MAG: MFS transporter [Candidatus Tectimicrobiota bacterium]|nr:MAG: MFS transporter [Candidatus Tectomicrobia bacterium]